MFTLLYNGTEKALADWGICADFALEFLNKGRDCLALRTTEDFDDGAAQFAWGQCVTLYRDRNPAPGGGFTDGALCFQGTVGEVRRLTEEGRQGIRYLIYGPWWLLERLHFKQPRVIFEAYSTPGNPQGGYVTTGAFLTEVYLGELPTEGPQTNGQQVAEVLNWANACYNPTRRGATSGIDPSQDILQIGAIDPQVNIPKTRVNDIFCSEAIINVLRWSPDAVCWFDYTTSPPTFNCRSLANLTVLPITITAEQEKQIHVAPQYERALAGVWLNYKSTQTVNGVAWPTLIVDKYPPTITDYTPNVAVHCIELAGAQVTRISVPVVTAPIAAVVAPDNAARTAWWLAADSSLANDPNIDPTSITCDPATVTDLQGNPLDLANTYPNTLIKGQLNSWMGVNWIDAIVTATISFNRYADANHKIPSATLEQKTVTHRVTLTNATTQTYRAVTHFDSGEAAPVGIAQAVYTSLSTLQYAGVITLVIPPGAPTDTFPVSLGCLLTLNGPNNSFPNCLLQTLRLTPHLGLTECAFNPSAPLDAPALVELARVGRWRIIYNLPSGRSTGQAPGAADVGLGTATQKENTIPGHANLNLLAATYNQGAAGANPDGTTQIALDAKGETFQLARLDASGAVLSQDGANNPLGFVRISQAATLGKSITLTTMKVCDPSTGSQKSVIVLASTPF